MSKRVVLTGSQSPDDVRDEFYFSSVRRYDGSADVGDQVTIVSEVTGCMLALGMIVSKGEPFEECRTVHVTQRFA